MPSAAPTSSASLCTSSHPVSCCTLAWDATPSKLSILPAGTLTTTGPYEPRFAPKWPGGDETVVASVPNIRKETVIRDCAAFAACAPCDPKQDELELAGHTMFRIRRYRYFFSALILSALGVGTGCQARCDIARACSRRRLPRRLACRRRTSCPGNSRKVVLPTYVIEPPDVLMIDAIHMVPRPPYHLRTLGPALDPGAGNAARRPDRRRLSDRAGRPGQARSRLRIGQGCRSDRGRGRGGDQQSPAALREGAGRFGHAGRHRRPNSRSPGSTW